MDRPPPRDAGFASSAFFLRMRTKQPFVRELPPEQVGEVDALDHDHCRNIQHGRTEKRQDELGRRSLRKFGVRLGLNSLSQPNFCQLGTPMFLLAACRIAGANRIADKAERSLRSQRQAPATFALKDLTGS
jgi:hypothetical protein